MKKITVIFITVNNSPVNLIDALRGLVGSMGSRLNPIQDINGDWFVSQEEWDSPEFEQFKIDNPAILAQFEDAEFTPVTFNPFN